MYCLLMRIGWRQSDPDSNSRCHSSRSNCHTEECMSIISISLQQRSEGRHLDVPLRMLDIDGCSDEDNPSIWGWMSQTLQTPTIRTLGQTHFVRRRTTGVTDPRESFLAIVKRRKRDGTVLSHAMNHLL